ncbi:hypothetical protein BH24ACT5_BH24ACT5_19280 [soil metagenome]
MARRDDALTDALAGDDLATTNLWYARLCKSAARAAAATSTSTSAGAILGGWDDDQRRTLVAHLVTLPDHIAVIPMRELAWSMGQLAHAHQGLSTRGAEAVAAALAMGGRVVVSARDDGPGIRRCCESVGVRYATVER